MRWVIPAATALWTIWKWLEQRDQERRKEQARIAALYVNPFLSACEDLQSRIYHILELQGLRSLRKRYPDLEYAEETLYLIVRYFGWLTSILRYGPYTEDSELIRLSEEVRKAFSTSEYLIGPFAFFRPEQKALGKMVMKRFEGQYGIELDTISMYEFTNRLRSPPLSESKSVNQTLEALREVKDAKKLPGRERLADAQVYLVELLSYLESHTGFSLFPGERKKCARGIKHTSKGSKPSRT
jgi:hypothetical protein